MLSINQAKKLLQIITPLFIAVFSIFVLATKVPEIKYMQETLESLEESKTTVMEFTGATLSASLIISALPGDFGTPLADALANMNQYFVFILIVIFVERLIVIQGVKIVFVYIVPTICALYLGAMLFNKDFLAGFANKLAILALAVTLVIPFSTHFVNIVGAEYLSYVDQTIAETNAGSEKMNEVTADDSSSDTIFDKLSDAFKTAINDMTDLMTYFKNIIKKCVNSIAILIVTSLVIPLLMLFFFRWLLCELFSLHLPAPDMKKLRGLHHKK